MGTLFSLLAVSQIQPGLTVLCVFNVAYLQSENNIGCLSGLDLKGNLCMCQKEEKGKYGREMFIKPNLKRMVYKI